MNVKFFIGIALETLLDDGEQTELKTFVHEFNPFVNGELLEDELIEIAIDNQAPLSTEVVEITASDHVLCEFGGVGHNIRRPSIHKGEQVFLVSINSSTDYFWFVLGRDYRRRMTEVVHMLVANKDETEVELDELNAYSIQVDTREGQKKLRIKTNKNMLEPFEYEIVLDTTAGTFKMTDDVGNVFTLDSNTNTFFLENVDKDSIKVSPGKIEVSTVDFIVSASGSVLIDTPSTTVTGTMDVTGASTFGATVAISSSMSAGGGGSIGGGFSAGGSISSGGSVSSASGFSGGPGVWHRH